MTVKNRRPAHWAGGPDLEAGNTPGARIVTGTANTTEAPEGHPHHVTRNPKREPHTRQEKPKRQRESAEQL